VAVGLLLTSQQTGRAVELTPQLILALFVPPLVFEAAFHIELNQLRENLVVLLVLTVPGVLLATLITGVVVAAGATSPCSAPWCSAP
jgi:CPA1 family monovalent cation:H+ antiporter